MLTLGRRATAALLTLCVVVFACWQRKHTNVDELLPRVEPFDQLNGVALRMTAQELVSLRPSVHNAAYFGMQDSIGGYDVAFHFPGNVRGDMDTPPGDRLRLVSARRTFPDGSEADAAFQGAVRAVGTALGNPSECFRISAERTIVHFALWSPDRTHVYVQYVRPRGPAGGTATVEPASVRTVVSTQPPPTPTRFTAVSEACPINASSDR